MSLQSLPIGVFDSGVGGLTVVSALKNHLPNENFIYLGDTARLPYGTKSESTVADYAMACGKFLKNEGIKLLVVACNTASSVAIESLQNALFPIPVVGVVKPGAIAGVNASKTGSIAVLATESTVKWHSYQKSINEINSNFTVEEWPCSLLVALAEEGWTKGELVESIIREILSPMLMGFTDRSDTVILGCTHFPVLKQAISNVLPDEICLIDSALSTARFVKQLLEDNQLLNNQNQLGKTRFMATDNLNRFKRIASIFLNYNIQDYDLELVDVLSQNLVNDSLLFPQSSNTKK